MTYIMAWLFGCYRQAGEAAAAAAAVCEARRLVPRLPGLALQVWR